MNEFIFNRKKIRYTMLNSLLANYDLEGDSLNLIIDHNYVMDILSVDFYKATNSIYESIKNSNEFITEYLNFISHYKKYFIDHVNISSINIFILFNDTSVSDKYKSLNDSTYNVKSLADMAHPTYNKFIYKKLKAVTNLLPNVYTISSDTIENSVILNVFQDILNKKSYNICLSNNPLFNQYTQTLNNFIILHASGEHSKIIGKNQFFEYLYKKNKYSTKNPTFDLNTHDSYIQLYLNLTGYNSDVAFTKNKKAIDIVNVIKQTSSIFEYNDSSIEILSKYIPNINDSDLIKRSSNYSVYEHYNLLGIDEINSIMSLYEESNQRDRREFNKLNDKFFNNRVNNVDILFTL